MDTPREWEEEFNRFEYNPISPTAVIREQLSWYKEHGSDHGDLVLAEEAIITTIKSFIRTLLDKAREEEQRAVLIFCREWIEREVEDSNGQSFPWDAQHLLKALETRLTALNEKEALSTAENDIVNPTTDV